VQERRDFLLLTQSLDTPVKESLLALWEEYNEGPTDEAIAVKALDKLETILQHNQGINPADFDYAFNLAFGEKYTNQRPLFKHIRNLMNQETLKKLE